MKRSQLIRKTPLKAHTHLKCSWIRRTRKPSKKNATYTKELREYIYERDGRHCYVCYRPGCQVHHVIPRGRFFAQWYTFDSVHDERNLMLLCASCHEKATNDNAELERLISLQEARFGPLRKNFEKVR